jgi:L-type amino acid transporter 8
MPFSHSSLTIFLLPFSSQLDVLKPFFPDCEPPNDAARMLAVCCICELSERPIVHKLTFSFAVLILVLLTFVNCYSVKWATAVQDVFTYAKLIALFIIIAFGVYLLSQGELIFLFFLFFSSDYFFASISGNVQYFNFDDTKTEVTSLALSFYSGLFAYNGW